MSTSVEIPLQAVDAKDKKMEGGNHTERLEQDDSRDNASPKGADRRQRSGTSPDTKGLAEIIAHLSMGVNVLTLNKYMIIIIIK